MAAAAMVACCPKGVEVSVENPTASERVNETVEVAWTAVAEHHPGITPAEVVVKNCQGEEIPSQVIYAGEEEPQAVIFQATVEGNGKACYTIVKGTPAAYPSKAFGRIVPERYDDYAWENNLVAYRLYGPALETSPEKLITPGIDVWVKCTEKLVIDEWYAKGDYHHNYGDGMDCYKVGRTLGGGASVPMVGGKFWPMEHNYATAKTLDNGPIRTCGAELCGVDGRWSARVAREAHHARRQQPLQQDGEHLHGCLRAAADCCGLRAPRGEGYRLG